MGAVFRPEEVANRRRWLLQKALRDLNPDVREAIRRIFASWQGLESEKKIIELLGEQRGKQLLKELTP